MKKYTYIALMGCLLGVVMGEELTVRHSSYGLGKHRRIDEEGGNVQLISSLTKNGFEYRSEMNQEDIKGIKIYRISDINNQSETIATFDYRLPLGSNLHADQWIVDVCATETEIAFVMASVFGYQYFKVSNQPQVAPPGTFLCERENVNSATWKVIQLQPTAVYFDSDDSDWKHQEHFKSVKLLSINSIEVKSNMDIISLYTITQNEIKKDGNSVGLSTFNPMLKTEAQLIAIFTGEFAESDEDVRTSVSFYKGGKDFVLNLLNQFSDQNAANQIRTRINQAYSGN